MLGLHESPFPDTDTMFSGQASANFNTKFQYFSAHFFAGFKIARLVGIKQDKRVHIAVASVEHISNFKAKFF